MSERALKVAQRSSIRVLEEEARSRAASVELHSPEHEFYFGVMTAARDHIHVENRAVHDEAWLSRQIPAFREGYLKTCTVIGIAGESPPHHLPLPAPG